MKHKKRSPANPLLPNPSDYCYAGGKKKRKYKSQLEAELFAPNHDLQQYVCNYCGFWHNGNSKAKRPGQV